jgi:hypothetical protein
MSLSQVTRMSTTTTALTLAIETLPLKEISANRTDSLKSSVQALLLDSPVPAHTPVKVVFTDSFREVEGWDSEQRLVGTQAITVLAPHDVSQRLLVDILAQLKEQGTTLQQQGAKLQQQGAEVAGLQQLVSQHAATIDSLASVPVRNLAAQILWLSAPGGAFQPPTVSSRLMADQTRVQSIATALGKSSHQFAHNGNRILTERKPLAHPESLEVLQAEATRVAAMITPALEGQFPWECLLVQRFGSFQEAVFGGE